MLTASDDHDGHDGGRRQSVGTETPAEFHEQGAWYQAIDGGSAVFFLEGEFDMSNASRLEHALREWVDSRSDASPTVIVDLAGVDFVDSTGLRTLLTILGVEPRLVLRRPSPPVVRLLEITVPGVFTIVA